MSRPQSPTKGRQTAARMWRLTPRMGSAHTIHHIAKLAKRANHGRDGTAYGRTRTSPKTFFVHHTQQLSLAAILGDAKAIRRDTRD